MTLQHDFMTLMDSGGPIMWVILAAACWAMILLIWQGLQVAAASKSAHSDYAQMRGNSEVLPLKSQSPMAQLLRQINWPQIDDQDALIKEINIQLAVVASRVEGHLSTIATLGSLLPMLGLLGTVTGMINVFEAIALHGSGQPEQMADGISQALLTTASGLIIAIPVIFLHHLLARRVQALMSVTGQSVQLILHHDVTQLKQTLDQGQ